jgi:hypothetical protein
MRNLIRKFQSYWLADASFVTLLIMLIAAVFVLPVIMEISGHGVLLFNILLLSVFFSGIFSTRSVGLISVWRFCSARLTPHHSFRKAVFIRPENIGIANILVFVFINLRLLFLMDRGAYRIVNGQRLPPASAHGALT